MLRVLGFVGSETDRFSCAKKKACEPQKSKTKPTSTSSSVPTYQKITPIPVYSLIYPLTPVNRRTLFPSCSFRKTRSISFLFIMLLFFKTLYTATTNSNTHTYPNTALDNINRYTQTHTHTYSYLTQKHTIKEMEKNGIKSFIMKIVILQLHKIISDNVSHTPTFIKLLSLSWIT